jgi:hypothetical protein
MNLHERQQFDFLLHTATERFVERLEERNGGPEGALRNLRENPACLTEFTNAIFTDFLLDNVAGACFVLQSLARRTIDPPVKGTIEAMLLTMAKGAFQNLLAQKTEEALEQRSAFAAAGGRE